MAHILLIGAAADASALEPELGAAVPIVVRTPDAAPAQWRTEPPEVIVVALDGSSDAALNNSLQLLAALGNEPGLQSVPVLALAPPGDRRALVSVLELGAADCAVLPLAAGEAEARVKALLRRKRLADQLAAEQHKVHRLATLDAVTGVYNRHYLDGAVNAAVVDSRAQATPLAVLMLDIDAFKVVNDRLGHAAGDRALAAIAARLVANVRAIDTVARYGGDELAVVMPTTDRTTARRIADRLCAAIADNIFPGNDLPQLTVSIGVAALCTGDADGSALLARADVALYDAKRNGRNRVACAA